MFVICSRDIGAPGDGIGGQTLFRALFERVEPLQPREDVGQFPVAHDALGAELHEQDEDERDDDPFPYLAQFVTVREKVGVVQDRVHPRQDEAQRLQQQGEDDGREHRSAQGAHSAQVDHDQAFRRFEDAEGVGVDVAQDVREESAGDPCQSAGEHEGYELHAVGVDTHDLGGHLVLAQVVERPTEAGILEQGEEQDGQTGEQPDEVEVVKEPKQIEQMEEVEIVKDDIDANPEEKE